MTMTIAAGPDRDVFGDGAGDHSTLQRYHTLNASFDDPFVFDLTDRGLYSEVNNLLNAIAFGLITRRRLLVRTASIQGVAWAGLFDTDLPAFSPAVPVDPEWIVANVNSPHFRTIRTTGTQMWERGERVDVEALGLAGMDIFALRRRLAGMFCVRRIDAGFWRAALRLPGIHCTDAAQMRRMRLRPGAFAALHVRRGDKIEGDPGHTDAAGNVVIEGEATPMAVCLELILAAAPTTDTLFVLTDDYAAIRELRALAPRLRLVTLCPRTSTGYRNRDFLQRPLAARTAALRRVLAEVQIAAQSALFAGPYKSNLARYVANIHRDPARCVSVDALRKWTPL